MSKTGRLRAFSVHDSSEESGVIVFATSRGRARSLARGTDVAAFDEFLDLIVRRERNADKYADQGGEGHLPWGDPKYDRIYRSLGWHSGETHSYCSECGLHVFDTLPESILDERGVCAGCNAEVASC